MTRLPWKNKHIHALLALMGLLLVLPRGVNADGPPLALRFQVFAQYSQTQPAPDGTVVEVYRQAPPTGVTIPPGANPLCGIAMVKSGFADLTPAFTESCPEGSLVAPSIVYPGSSGVRTGQSPDNVNRVAAIPDKSIEWRTALPSDVVPRLVVLTTAPPPTAAGQTSPANPSANNVYPDVSSGTTSIKPPATGQAGLH